MDDTVQTRETARHCTARAGWPIIGEHRHCHRNGHLVPWVPATVTGFSRTAAILSAIVLGGLLPQAHHFAWTIRWLIMAMLFLVFLQTRFSRSALSRSHLWLLTANLVIGFVSFGLGWALGGREIALAAFFCGITPTATAAPVIISFLRGRVDYVVAAFLLTNLSIAALMPLMLPLVLGHATPEAFAQVVGSVGLVVFVPMGLAHLVRAVHKPACAWPAKLRNVSFGIWITMMLLITANASAYIRDHANTPLPLLLKMAGISLVICAANFAVGRLVGGREFQREASQALGQKNTTLTIYLAMAYASPLIALGPTFYVVWHNLWNSWQLHRAGRSEPTH
jgi:BASS family bile acid:Na+ symporter